MAILEDWVIKLLEQTDAREVVMYAGDCYVVSPASDWLKCYFLDSQRLKR